MIVYEMVVAIVLISVFGGIVRQYLKQRGAARPDADLENDRLKSEVAGLKDRIATLERIATDKPRRLAEEIDALGRDKLT